MCVCDQAEAAAQRRRGHGDWAHLPSRHDPPSGRPRAVPGGRERFPPAAAAAAAARCVGRPVRGRRAMSPPLPGPRASGEVTATAAAAALRQHSGSHGSWRRHAWRTRGSGTSSHERIGSVDTGGRPTTKMVSCARENKHILDEPPTRMLTCHQQASAAAAAICCAC